MILSHWADDVWADGAWLPSTWGSVTPPVPPAPGLGGGSGGGKKKRKQSYRETHVVYLGKTVERPNTLEADLRKAFNIAFNIPDDSGPELISAARQIQQIATPNLSNPKRPVIDLAAVMAREETTRRIFEINATLQTLLGLKAEADRVLEARTQAIALEANLALKRLLDEEDDDEIILLFQSSI